MSNKSAAAMEMQDCLQELSQLRPHDPMENLAEFYDSSEPIFVLTAKQRARLLNSLGACVTSFMEVQYEEEDSGGEPLPVCADVKSEDGDEEAKVVVVTAEKRRLDDEDDVPLLPTKRTRKRPLKLVKDEEDDDASSEPEDDFGTISKKRGNLKNLVRTLCDVAADKRVPSNFDVMQGQTFQFYGLTRAYTQEICFILETCPVFAGKNHFFYSEIFKAAPKSWVHKLRQYRRWLEGHNMTVAKKHKISTKSPLIQEVVKLGFQPFNPFSLEEMNNRLSQVEKSMRTKAEADMSSLNLAQEAAVVTRKERKPRPSIVDASSLLHKPLKGKLGYEIPFVSEQPNTSCTLTPNTVIKVLCNKPPYTAHDVYHHKMSLIPDLVVQKAFALVALVVNDSMPHKAKVLLQPKVVTDDFCTQMEDLFNALNGAWSITGQDFFKVTYVLPPGKDEKKYKKITTKREYEAMHQLGEEGVKRKLLEIEAQIEATYPAQPHVPIVDLNVNEEHIIEILDTIDAAEVNNFAVLLGDSPNNITIRTLMTEESFQKYVTGYSFGRGAPAHTSKIYEQKYNFNQLVRVFLELFRMFSGLDMRQMITHVPFYGREHDRLRDLVSMKSGCDNFLEKVSKQCPHCGKVFKVNKTSVENGTVLEHIKFCQLERSNCGCGLTFRTAREKRRHMLLSHSGIKYYECSQCNFVNKSQKTVDHHFEYFHGYPGCQEMCDLCFKTFKCKNHLQVHRFNHENYWCSVCQLEFLGRISFRNHMKKIHAAGFVCDFCSKVCFTKPELNKHKKAVHEDAAYLNT